MLVGAVVVLTSAQLRADGLVRVVHTLQPSLTPVAIVAFSPDGTRLMSAGGDHRVGSELILWDVSTGVPVYTIPYDGMTLRAVEFTPDGQQLAVGGVFVDPPEWGSRVDVIAIPDAHVVQTFRYQGMLTSIALGGGGVYLASGGEKAGPGYRGEVLVWSPSTGRLIWNHDGHASQVNAVAISPNGRQLASGSNDMAIRLWDVRTGRLLKTLDGHTVRVLALAYSPDGRMLASGSAGHGAVKLWEVVWTGREIRTLGGHAGPVRSVEFTPDGRFLATAGGTILGGHVCLWDPETGERLYSLEAHTRAVTCVAFSPDGRLLATASDDGMVKIWDVSRLTIGETE